MTTAELLAKTLEKQTLEEQMAKPTPKFDRRLIGTWKSDRAETFRHFQPAPSVTPEALAKLKALFGRFRIRWGYRHVSTELDDFKDVKQYEFIARDSTSVVVRVFDELSQEYELVQIHFEGKFYWLRSSALGEIREYFRRVKEPT